MKDVADMVQVRAIEEELETTMLPPPPESQGFMLVTFEDANQSKCFLVHYDAVGGTFFASEDHDPSDDAWDALEEFVAEQRGDASAAAVVMTYRSSDGVWWAGLEAGSAALRWNVSPGTFEALAAEVCPL